MSDEERQTGLLPGGAPEKMFYKIRDVAQIADVKTHVLRYWESEFPTLKPHKNKNGQRIYSRKEIDLILEIKRLLYVEKYSIAGAKQYFRNKRSPKVATTKRVSEKKSDTLREIRASLADLLNTLNQTS